MRRTDIQEGQTVAVRPDRAWHKRPQLVRPARVVDLGPFTTGTRRQGVMVDGDEVQTYHYRAPGGQFVAIRYTDPVGGEIPMVEFVNTVKLIDVWDNWLRIRAELDAAQERAEQAQADALAQRQARRRVTADLLAMRGIVVNTYRDFDDDDRVVLTESQVRKLVL